jgi:hypothetical protein
MEPADPTPAGFFGWCERPCRSAMAASFFGSTVMYVAASRNVTSFRPPSSDSDPRTFAASPCQPSGQQIGAGRCELNKCSAVMNFQPAPFNGALQAGAVFRGCALVAE